MTNTTTDDNLIELPPEQNRAQRRTKGRHLTIADMRQWQAESIKQKLFTPKKTDDGKAK